jgi:peptidoglycan/xylan/chitin deacetylase (PgdA/CDA1 family)
MERRDFLKLSALGIISPAFLFKALSEYNFTKRSIYLTIDDGPRKNMPLILENLKGNSATFYLIGEQIANKTGFYHACRAIEKGNLIGNHSYTHSRFHKLSLEQAQDEVSKTDELIEKVYFSVGKQREKKMFRFPYGDKGGANFSALEQFLLEKGYSIQSWDVDAKDWKYYKNPGSITEEEVLYNCFNAKDGDIVLTHDNSLTAEKIIPMYVEAGIFELILP